MGESVQYLKMNHQKEGAARKIFLYVRTSRQTYKFYPKWWRTQYWAIKGKGSSSEETETFLPCGNISKNWSTDFRPVMNLQDPIRPSKEFIFHGIPWNTKKKLFYQILRQHSIYDHKDFNQTFHYATAWKNVLRKCWVRVRRACAQFNTWIISLHNQLSSLKG